MSTKLTYVTYKKRGYWMPSRWVFSMQLYFIYILGAVKLDKEQIWVRYYRRSLLTKVREDQLDLLLDEFIFDVSRNELIVRILINFHKLVKDDPRMGSVKLIEKMYTSLQNSSPISRLLKRKRKLPYELWSISAPDPDDPFSNEFGIVPESYFQRLLNLLEERSCAPKMKLGKKIILEHNIYSSYSFSEAHEHIKLFKTVTNTYGVLIYGKLIIAAVYDGIYSCVSLKMLVAHMKHPDKPFSEYHFFDLEGNLIKKTTDYNRIYHSGSDNQDMELFYTVKLKNSSKPQLEYKNQLIGVWNENLNELIPSIYEHLSYLNKERFAVAKEGKWGVINAKNETILNFEYDKIVGQFTEELILAKKEGHYFKVDVSGNLVGKADFSHILNLSRDRHIVLGKKPRNYYRIIKGGKHNKSEDGFDLDLNILKFDGAWGLLDEGFNEVILPQYRYIRFFENRDFFMVMNGVLTWSENEPDEEGRYTTISNIKCGVIDAQNNIIVPLEYTWIEEVYKWNDKDDGNHWIINKGGTVYYDHEEKYWGVGNGKFGVMNNRCEVIVPVIYDTILNNQSVRRKPYYFAQNGKHYFDQNSPYHAYNLTGQRLTTNIPHPYKD